MSNVQKGSGGRGRPALPPKLTPEEPSAILGWTLRKLRQAAGWNISKTANAFGCSASHISRVEHGAKPSRELVQFYDDTFDGDGLPLSLFEAADYAPEQRRRSGRRPRRGRGVEGDAVAFVYQSVPHGQLMKPGQRFPAVWRIRNVGTVPWRSRRLERQGPLNGPGLIVSPRFIPVPDTDPGEEAEIMVPLRAPGYDCTSIAYFKMVDERGFLCFPEDHQLGLDVLIRVVRNTGGAQ